jgi:phage replication initiation protein
LHWLGFTFPDDIPIEDVKDLLGMVEATWAEGVGAMGYRTGYRHKHVTILSDGQPGMGVHVEVTGEGIGELAEAYHLVSEDHWRSYLRVLDGFVRKWSRTDVAHDDREGILDLGEVERAAQAGDFTSRWSRKVRCIREVEDGAIEGRTVYLGQRSSNCFVRIYDAAAKRHLEGVHWVRVEQVFRDERATAIIHGIIERGFTFAAAVLRGYLDFKHPTPDEPRRERWQPADWWLTFLKGCDKATLAIERVARSVAKAKTWIEHQVAPSFALVAKWLGPTAEVWEEHLVKVGRKRWTKEQKDLLGEAGGPGAGIGHYRVA